MTAAAAVATDSDADADTANCVESVWSKLKGPLLDAATKVCGLSNNHQWKPETLWGNEEVDKAIQENRARYKVYSALKTGGMTPAAKRAKTAYIDAKRVAKHSVCLAKSEVENESFSTVSPDGDGVFCIAKQKHSRNQDIVGENCVHIDTGELALTDQDKMKAWVEHYARLLNVEFVWPSNKLPQVPPTAGPLPSVSAAQILKHSAQ